MPKYYCEYCDIYLPPNSLAVRREHFEGRNHLANVRHYYETWIQEQIQATINQRTVQFNSRRMASAPYTIPRPAPPPPPYSLPFINVNIPPPKFVRLPNAASIQPHYQQ